jgi:hypothetical protein
MIEKEQIENLGYNLKVEVINNTLDFVIQDDFLPQRINLADGNIHTISAINSKEQQKSFSDIAEFIKYYGSKKPHQ